MDKLIPSPVTALAAITSAMVTTYLDGRFAISRDITQLRHDKSFKQRVGQRVQQLGDEVTLYRILELADPGAEALWFEGRTWTYAQIKEVVDQLAWVLLGLGVKTGDLVAVFMTNSPEMVFVIYAIAKLGAASTLLNSALRNDTLLHCIKIANAKLVISTPDLTEYIQQITVSTPELTEFLHQITHSKCETFQHASLNLGSYPIQPLPSPPSQTSLDRLIHITPSTLSTTRPPHHFDRPKRAAKDISLLIYTSGTSGAPKAVSIKNFHLVIVSTATSLDHSNPKKYFPLRIYSPLPLFHGTCLFTGLAYSAGSSGCFCLARRFSASTFTRDLVASAATRMLYVGELCRYLVLSAPTPYDNQHSCIVATGNGLQRDIWRAFKTRLAIPEIREFYRSTEGIAKFDNFGYGDTGAGKVGFAGSIAQWLEDDVVLARYEPETESLYRDPRSGFSVPARMGEPGEAIGRVRSMDFYSEYFGNRAATESKLIRDVFAKGDLWQRTGDLLVREEDGWVKFHDRTGDTFRWKGENVSAGEVRAFISEVEGAGDVVVYGVKLEGYDGQVGAAAVTLTTESKKAEEAFVRGLYRALRERGLPAYAVPRLLRFTKKIATSHTFKHSKLDLKKLSWQPGSELNGDHLYWLDGEVYRPLDERSWGDIRAARAKL